LETVAERGRYLHDGLQAIATDLGHGEVRGRGLLLALELKNRDAAKVSRTALDRGLLVNAPRPDALRFMSSLVVSRGEIDEMLKRRRPSLELHGARQDGGGVPGASGPQFGACSGIGSGASSKRRRDADGVSRYSTPRRSLANSRSRWRILLDRRRCSATLLR